MDCIESTSRFDLTPKLYRFIPEMTTKHFGHSSPANSRLLSLVLEAAMRDTRIFFKLFQKGKVFVSETNMVETAILKARPELQSWFFKRYEIRRINGLGYITMAKFK